MNKAGSLGYTIDNLRFGVDPGTYQRAIEIYEKKKVTNFQRFLHASSATVRGTHQYDVIVDTRHYDRGSCTCYLGQQDILCKHMIAVALYSLLEGRPLQPSHKESTDAPVCSGELGTLDAMELRSAQSQIKIGLSCIKAYNGPSRTWFAYQARLCEGCSRLSETVSKLPVSQKTAKMLVQLLLKLDDKLCRSGVDDSDGTVGTFMEETVQVLIQFAALDPSCIKEFTVLQNKETCFGWEETLIKLDKQSAKTS